MMTVDGPKEMQEIHRKDREQAYQTSRLNRFESDQDSLAATVGAIRARNAVLTDSEKKVLSHLADAWLEFQSLPDKHSDDCDDVRSAIHRIQDIIGVRVARRLEPDMWWKSKS